MKNSAKIAIGVTAVILIAGAVLVAQGQLFRGAARLKLLTPSQKCAALKALGKPCPRDSKGGVQPSSSPARPSAPATSPATSPTQPGPPQQQESPAAPAIQLSAAPRSMSPKDILPGLTDVLVGEWDITASTGGDYEVQRLCFDLNPRNVIRPDAFLNAKLVVGDEALRTVYASVVRQEHIDGVCFAPYQLSVYFRGRAGEVSNLRLFVDVSPNAPAGVQFAPILEGAPSGAVTIRNAQLKAELDSSTPWSGIFQIPNATVLQFRLSAIYDSIELQAVKFAIDGDPQNAIDMFELSDDTGRVYGFTILPHGAKEITMPLSTYSRIQKDTGRTYKLEARRTSIPYLNPRPQFNIRLTEAIGRSLDEGLAVHADGVPVIGSRFTVE